jgi:hypothetical protein
VPSSQTKLNVWNLALDLISETALQSPTEDSAAGRWLTREWDHVVATLLRSYVWGFAKQRFSISADATNPPFKWSYRYKMPAGTIRVLPITRYGDRTGAPVVHEIVGDYIETNEPAPLYVTCIMDYSNNPGKWDALFTEMVRCTLAVGMANKFPGKVKYIDRAERALMRAQLKAEEIEALEGSAEPTEEANIIRAREADYTGNGFTY